MDQTLADSQAATFSIALSKEGINTTFMAEFTPDSESGKTVAKVKNTDASLLAGLPESEYLFYGGFVQNPELTASLFSKLADPLAKELANLGDEGKSLQTAIDAMLANLKATKGAEFGAILDPNGGPAGLLKAVSVIDGDSKQILSSQEKLRATMQDLMQIMPGPKQKFTFTPAAKTVDGIKFDLVQSTIQPDPKKPEEMMAQQMAQLLYGANGTRAYMAAPDDKHVLQIMGDDETLMSSAVTSAKAGTDTVVQQVQVKDVADRLPKQRFGVVYLGVDKVVTAGIKIANMQMGQNIQMQLPPNLPPWGNTYATAGSAIRIDSHVSSQLIQAMVAASMQAMMQARPHGGGGKPGDL